MSRLLPTLAILLLAIAGPAMSADPPLDTVVVTGSPEEVERQIQAFVGSITRVDGDLIGRWRDRICPMVLGLSESQAQFMRRRLVDVQNTVRKLKPEGEKPCAPNLFVIVTDEADKVINSWKERAPGMFRWKTPDGVSHSNGTGAVRTWHNAVVEPSDGGPLNRIDMPGASVPRGRLQDSRIKESAAEHIDTVIVLVDTQAAGKVSLAQITDYAALVSLAQIDLTASVGGTNSILRLFGEPRPDVPPTGLTEWDFAFLNGIYRSSYTPMQQRRDIAARMTRELAPR